MIHLLGQLINHKNNLLLLNGNKFLCNNFKETKLFFTLWQDLCSNTTLLLQKDFTCDIFSVNFLKFSQVPVRSHSISWTAVVADHRLRLQVPPQSPLCHSTLTVSPISWLCMFVLVMQFQDPNHLSFFATLITKDVVCACLYNNVVMFIFHVWVRFAREIGIKRLYLVWSNISPEF